MGIVLSKLRKEKSTEAVLEGLQTQIQALEKYMINTEERKRRFVTNFVGFTIGAYIVGFGLWWYFYFPPTMKECFMYLVPLLLFPIVIIFLRRLFTWYFQRKLNKNGDKLTRLKEDKRKILEQVMDKETYKVAVNLLERFGDKKQLRISGLPTSSTPNRPQVERSPLTVAAVTRTSSAGGQQQQQRSLAPYTNVYRNNNNNQNTSLNSSVISSQSLGQMTSASPQLRAVQELRRRSPFPIVDDRSRSALDRIVDFIVGDSPKDRFGMICKACHAHNGMLPKEEYEYTTFRCAFCNVLNPARKKRPVAPRLSLEAPSDTANKRNDSSESESSDDDSDKEPSARRALLQKVPSGGTDMDTTAVTEDLAMETETIETGPAAASISTAEVAASS
ncbi:endoplasmic reticulum junction formation protein lunapark [Drosophila sechellia]|uniref:Endoplasmic reticulum junction formation protein lunapark n=1 Tax=Drosophila sechellia TaxID=7238 RepID=B4HRZ7_DROSE|nr:endoplasmic reticulum junction formation protein lunapark [Drosophila sechellia]EDW46960.1 GM20675 [Drosophila sechellia]